MLTVLEEKIAFAKSKIAAVATNDESFRLLMTMLGLDYFAASLLVAEICDINHFSSDKRLVSWVGLAPGLRQSGEKLVTCRIIRQGNMLGYMIKDSANSMSGTLGGKAIRK